MVISVPRLHFTPIQQTTPDIYAASTSIRPGQFLDNCCFYEWTITLTREGHAKYLTGDRQEFDLRRGDLVLTKPRVWHAWRVASLPNCVGESTYDQPVCWDIAYSVFNARPHWSSWLDRLPFEDGTARLHFDAKATADLERLFVQLAHAFASGSHFRDSRAMAILELVLVTVAERADRFQYIPDKRIRDAVDSIQDRYSEALAVTDLATAAHLSAAHFSALFTASVGMPPAQYVDWVRLDRAAEMLRFGASSIGDVSRSVGFSEPKYFAHRFRLRFGQTPREYRRASRVSDGNPLKSAARS